MSRPSWEIQELLRNLKIRFLDPTVHCSQRVSHMGLSCTISKDSLQLLQVCLGLTAAPIGFESVENVVLVAIDFENLGNVKTTTIG